MRCALSLFLHSLKDEGLQGRPGGGVEFEDLPFMNGIDPVGQGNVVAADLTGTREVGGRVVIAPESLQLPLPDHPAGIDIHCAQHVRPLDEQAPARHLRRRPVTVPRQHSFVIRSTEPQQAQRRLHQFVLRNHGLSRIRILVRPVVGLRQGALADQARHAVLPFGPRLFQCLRSRHDPREGLVLLARTGEHRHPSVGPERAEQIPDKFPVTWLEPGS